VTLLFVDGFDDGLYSQKWTQLGGTQAINPARNGLGLQLSRDDHFVRYQTPAADEHATFIVGFAWYAWSDINFGGGAAPAGMFLALESDSGGTRHIYVTVDLSRRFSVYQGNGTLLAITDPNIFEWNVWTYLELKANLHDTTGSFSFRKDGDVLLSGTGIDTKNGGTKTVFDSLRLRGFSGGGSGLGQLVDDLYLLNSAGSLNNDLLGDCTVETLFPSGNGNSSQLVGSDGNSVDNYLLVDEAPNPSSVDYVGSGTNNAKDTYAFTNLVHTTGAVRGIAMRAYAAKSDTGARTLSNVVRTSGVDTVLPAQFLGTGYAIQTDILEQDPNGPTAWTIASVNAAEFGVQVGAP